MDYDGHTAINSVFGLGGFTTFSDPILHYSVILLTIRCWFDMFDFPQILDVA